MAQKEQEENTYYAQDLLESSYSPYIIYIKSSKFHAFFKLSLPKKAGRGADHHQVARLELHVV